MNLSNQLIPKLSDETIVLIMLSSGHFKGSFYHRVPGMLTGGEVIAGVLQSIENKSLVADLELGENGQVLSTSESGEVVNFQLLDLEGNEKHLDVDDIFFSISGVHIVEMEENE